jgi:outer membrane receptor protein involved in Fe transport
LSIPLKSKGKGMNYGIEITLEKFFTKNYYFLYTASFFNSQYTGSDNVWRNTAFNANYVMNGLGGKEFIVGKRKINRIGVNAKILWRGGLRDTPIDLEASRQAGATVYDFSKAYSIRLPDYFRIDFGASYRRNKKKYAWVLALDIQNVINRLNVAAKVYNKNTEQIETKKNLGIIPILSYKVEF